MKGRQELVFVVFLLHQLSSAWGVTPSRVYKILSDSQVLQKYIVPCYDTLHSLGSKYLVDDITNCVREWGYEIS